jgi:hypothetical protein
MKELALARGCWEQVLRSDDDFVIQSSFGYIDVLIREGFPAEAHQVWEETLTRSGTLPEVSDSNLLFNGSFEQPTLGSGFDWRLRTSPHLSVIETSAQRFHEYRSLRLVFDGGNWWTILLQPPGLKSGVHHLTTDPDRGPLD